MNLKELFETLLNVTYIQLAEETASYYTHRDGDTLYIFFEWSRGKTDWINNFDFPAKPYRDMADKWYCHRGFLRVFKACEPLIKDKITDPNVKHIVIAGYSHGAAVAQLCHEYCRFNRPDIEIEGYGFGGPRVLWGKVSETVRKRFNGYTLVCNGKDLITHLPPVLFGFRHVGSPLNIGEHIGPIKDHFPDRYRQALEEYERSRK